jgi:ribonuclease HII
MKKFPNLYYERSLWRSGLKYVAGCDEVGRGCFAGPVVASAVVLAPNSKILFPTSNEKGEKIIINDSKRLTSLQRKSAEDWIRKNSLAYGIGVGSVGHINKYGIISATNFAFRSAIKHLQSNLSHNLEYLLIDAFYIPYIRGFKVPHKTDRKVVRTDHKNTKEDKDTKISKVANEDLDVATFKISDGRQLAIVKGDSRSVSIAAASIIAKVYRDNLMQSLSQKSKYKIYGWDKNKGYGTKEHTNIIRQYGISKHHRTQFVQTFLANNTT